MGLCTEAPEPRGQLPLLHGGREMPCPTLCLSLAPAGNNNAVGPHASDSDGSGCWCYNINNQVVKLCLGLWAVVSHSAAAFPPTHIPYRTAHTGLTCDRIRLTDGLVTFPAQPDNTVARRGHPVKKILCSTSVRWADYFFHGMSLPAYRRIVQATAWPRFDTNMYTNRESYAHRGLTTCWHKLHNVLYYRQLSCLVFHILSYAYGPIWS